MLIRSKSLCFHRHMPRSVPDSAFLEPANKIRKESAAMCAFRIRSAVSRPYHINCPSGET